MRSASFIRTLIILGLFAVLICDYSRLICQIYQTLREGDDEPIVRGFKEDLTPATSDSEIVLYDYSAFGGRERSEVITIVKTACLPKLICELTATRANARLTDSEKGILDLLSSTSLGTMAEVTSRYHFAAHMGQLIAGVEGTGCHVFYPMCPMKGKDIMPLLRKVKLRS